MTTSRLRHPHKSAEEGVSANYCCFGFPCLPDTTILPLIIKLAIQ